MRRAFSVSLLVSTLLAAGPSAQQSAPAPAPASPAPAGTGPAGRQQPAGPPAPAQGAQPVQPGPGQPAITFKTEVNYVEVDAVVTNEKGDFVKNLKPEDFTVLEDGKPQKIELFNQVDIPREPQDRFLFMNRPVKLDVKSNRDPFAGRLYVIVLDDLHVAALRSPLVKKAAHQFIEKYFHANDVAAIVYTSGRTNASQEFTSNPALLLASIDKFMGNKLRSATLNKLDTYNQQRSSQPSDSGSDGSGSSSNSPSNSGNKIQDSDDFQRGYNARNALDTLRNVADFLSGIRGRRKALLYFSEGIDYPIYDIFDAHDASQVVMSTKDAITAAARANVNFFTIDPRGLVGLPDENMDLSAPPEDPSLRLDTQGLLDELRLSQDSLRTLAEETGGTALVNTNDFAGYFDKVVRANSTYYVIGYYPPDAKRDGRFHKIEVRVKQQPGQAKLNVSARKGYANPRGKSPDEKAKEDAEKLARDAKKAGATLTSAPLRDVLNSPLQTSGVTIDVQAAPFKNSPKDASIALAIEIDPGKLNFKPAKAQDKKTGQDVDVFEDNIELSFFSLNESGKPLGGTRSEVNLRLRPQNYQLVKAFGLRLNPRIKLEPGRYQIRIGVRETGGGDVGTVFYDLDVPDFTKNDLSISGILLTAATAQFIPTPQPDEVLTKELLPLPATSRREFIQGDTLALFTEVYDNLPSNKPHKIDITTRLLAEDGREVFKAEEPRDSSELKSSQKGGGYGHTAQIPLKDVTPGRYLLTVDAIPRNRDKNTKAVSRETLIVVHPAPPELRRPAGGGAPGQSQPDANQAKKPSGDRE